MANKILLRSQIVDFLYEEKQIPSREFVENWSEKLLYTLYSRYCDLLEAESLKKVQEINDL